MFRGNITGFVIFVFIAFSTIGKANENNQIVFKTTSKPVGYGIDLDGFEDELLAGLGHFHLNID